MKLYSVNIVWKSEKIKNQYRCSLKLILCIHSALFPFRRCIGAPTNARIFTHLQQSQRYSTATTATAKLLRPHSRSEHSPTAAELFRACETSRDFASALLFGLRSVSPSADHQFLRSCFRLSDSTHSQSTKVCSFFFRFRKFIFITFKFPTIKTHLHLYPALVFMSPSYLSCARAPRAQHMNRADY